MLKSPTVTNLDNFIVEEKIKFQNYLLMGVCLSHTAWFQ